VRYKAFYTAVTTAVLFWGPSIGSSGMTDAVTPGSEVNRAVFGWHSEDKNEARLLAELNSAVFELTADDSEKLFQATTLKSGRRN
jgi:hypothetical protein